MFLIQYHGVHLPLNHFRPCSHPLSWPRRCPGWWPSSCYSVCCRCGTAGSWPGPAHCAWPELFNLDIELHRYSPYSQRSSWTCFKSDHHLVIEVKDLYRHSWRIKVLVGPYNKYSECCEYLCSSMSRLESPISCPGSLSECYLLAQEQTQSDCSLGADIKTVHILQIQCRCSASQHLGIEAKSPWKYQ